MRGGGGSRRLGVSQYPEEAERLLPSNCLFIPSTTRVDPEQWDRDPRFAGRRVCGRALFDLSPTPCAHRQIGAVLSTDDVGVEVPCGLQIPSNFHGVHTQGNFHPPPICAASGVRVPAAVLLGFRQELPHAHRQPRLAAAGQ